MTDDRLAPGGVRAWYPEPRGVGRSKGGPHDLERAVADLEEVRGAAGVQAWVLLGHSWGSDLAVRYALDHPDRIRSVVGVAGHNWEPAVHAALGESFVRWIHEPGLLRRLSDSRVHMKFIAPQHDIRPSWPLRQLATLVPHGAFEEIPGVAHNFWATDPQVWAEVVMRACAAASSGA
ncbi:alpha/beta fold hydrolase [Nocardia albiluteola]|uniref:alpha/beta fold hydrolase n=1 Tax=Nocardia albiluteola TaxID=2842303 RepID=UPI0035564CF4